MISFQNAWETMLHSSTVLSVGNVWQVIERDGWRASDLNLEQMALCMCLYVGTYYRFLKGDDAFIEDLRKPGHETGLMADTDTAGLLPQGIVFICLGLGVTQPEAFVWVYAALLGLNIAWLSWSLWRNVSVTQSPNGVSLQISPCQEIACTWIATNVITFVALLVIEIVRYAMILDGAVCLWLELLVILANNYIDFSKHRNLYFG